MRTGPRWQANANHGGALLDGGGAEQAEKALVDECTTRVANMRQTLLWPKGGRVSSRRKEADALYSETLSMRAEVLKILQAGEPVLRQRASELSTKEIRSRAIQKLIENMRETMYNAPGLGLAAPQIGRGLQLAVIEDKPEYIQDSPAEFIRERERQPVPFHVIINPKLTLLESANVEFFEGCLSLAGFTAVVPRARMVRVECLNERGEPKVIEASGWYARILQHEIDHLQGTIYIDRMQPRTFMGMELFNQYWKGKSMGEVVKQILLA